MLMKLHLNGNPVHLRAGVWVLVSILFHALDSMSVVETRKRVAFWTEMLLHRHRRHCICQIGD